MATESPMVSTAPISVTKMNAGSSAQNELPKPKSKPGQSASGRPTQAALAMPSVS